MNLELNQIDVPLSKGLRAYCTVTVARTAAGQWASGYEVRFKHHSKHEACQLAGAAWPSAATARTNALLRAVGWLRAWPGSTRARLELLHYAKVGGVRT